MNRPLWILNSFLLFCVLFTLIFILSLRPKIPHMRPIEQTTSSPFTQEETLKINTRKIYEQDIFGTFQRETPRPIDDDFIDPAPPPPTLNDLLIPETPKPEFFEPLNIALKGITVVINNTEKNRAIVADNKTNTETIYKEGDTVEDAQLVRILSNKVIFLRSNGQQEVLYLREKDAQEDPLYRAVDDWGDVIQKVAQHKYLINPITFVQRVRNLARLIDILDITTAYQRGNSIGSRIGLFDNQSLAPSLGLKTGDIITLINGIPTTTTTNRVAIYQNIINLHENDTIEVMLRRNNEEIVLHYTLHEFKIERDVLAVSDEKLSTPSLPSKTLQKEQKKILEQKYKFAPTAREIRERERRHMRQQGGRHPLTPITE